jgi:hypothetical protein
VFVKTAARGARIRLGLMKGAQLTPRDASILRNTPGIEFMEDLVIDKLPPWPIVLVRGDGRSSEAVRWSREEDYYREGFSPETGASGLNLLVDEHQVSKEIPMLRNYFDRR